MQFHWKLYLWCASSKISGVWEKRLNIRSDLESIWTYVVSQPSRFLFAPIRTRCHPAHQSRHTHKVPNWWTNHMCLIEKDGWNFWMHSLSKVLIKWMSITWWDEIISYSTKLWDRHCCITQQISYFHENVLWDIFLLLLLVLCFPNVLNICLVLG